MQSIAAASSRGFGKSSADIPWAVLVVKVVSVTTTWPLGAAASAGMAHQGRDTASGLIGIASPDDATATLAHRTGTRNGPRRPI